MKSISVGELVSKGRKRSINPADFPEEEFELYSVPSHSTGEPEMSFGEEIKSNKQHVYPGDVLLCKINPRINRVWTVRPKRDNRQIGSTEWICLSPPNDLMSEYLAYFLQQNHIREYLAQNVSGVGGSLMRIRPTVLDPIKISFPSSELQQALVHKIENAMGIIDSVECTVHTMQRRIRSLRQSILKAACEGRLVPTEAELAAGEERDFETGGQLLERILQERRNSFSGRGKYRNPVEVDLTLSFAELPEGWAWATFDQVADIRLGKMLDKTKHREGKLLPYLRNVNVRWRKVETDDMLSMFFRDEEVERYTVRQGDLLVCEGGEPGRAGIYEGEDLTFQKALHRVRPYCNVRAQHLMNWLQYLAASGKLSRFFTGSTIKHFTGEAFKSLPLPLPPLEEQVRIVQETERRFSLLDDLANLVRGNIENCIYLRQSILSRAFTLDDIEETL